MTLGFSGKPNCLPTDEVDVQRKLINRPPPTDSKHYVVLVRIGERPVISQFDAETLAIVVVVAEPGQSQREAIVKGMARLKETAINRSWPRADTWTRIA
jgi:hypothetical protein